MKTKLEYQQDVSQAERVRRLLVMPEFETMKAVLKRIYDADVERIIAGEDSEARARIKFNKDLLDELDADIARGKDADEALKEGRYSDSPQGG